MWFYVLAAALIALDQGSKAWVIRSVLPGESVPVVPGYFHLTHVQNQGAAFGILQGRIGVLVAITLGVLVVCALFRKRIAEGSLLMRLGYTVGLSGALGNVIDRVVRGWVVDFLDFRVWPVFNLADVSIVTGAALLFWSILKEGEGESALADEA